MKPLKNKLIVAVNQFEKDDYSVTLPSGLTLFMRSNYSFDGKSTNPVLAKVVAVGDGITDINPNDILLVHYNAFKRVVTHASNGAEVLLGDMGVKDENNLDLFCLEYSFAWCKLDEHGDPLPLDNILIVETIEKPGLISGVMELIDLKKEYTPNTFKVVRAGSKCEHISNGDTVVCYDKSNLLIKYTWNSIMKECFRIEYENVLAIKKES